MQGLTPGLLINEANVMKFEENIENNVCSHTVSPNIGIEPHSYSEGPHQLLTANQRRLYKTAAGLICRAARYRLLMQKV